MGYTHYWYRRLEIDPAIYHEIVEDFRRLLPIMSKHDLRLADGHGQGEPVITESSIWFNGPQNCGHKLNRAVRIPWPASGAGGVSSADEDPVAGRWYAGAQLNKRACNGDCSYETLDFPRVMRLDRFIQAAENGMVFNFCKTAFRPYDIAVTGCLVIAKHHLGEELRVASDGDIDHWFDGMMLCQMELGYGLDFQLPVEE